jgi:prepilin-type N-terminal cleavage/methylation domain-containing protein
MQKSKQAFTLVELLVVISIILVASSIIFIGGNGGDGAKLSSAQRIVAGIAQGARGQAILKNAKTRLIIYTDNNGSSDSDSEYDKQLRFFGIVYWGTDEDGEEGWIAATQGTYLPEGVYFNETLSETHGWPKDTMNIGYPRLSAQTDAAVSGKTNEFYYYEFDSNGTMSSSPKDFTSNPWLVVQVGTLQPSSSGFEVVFPSSGDEDYWLCSAIIFRRVGTTTRVVEPDDIL